MADTIILRKSCKTINRNWNENASSQPSSLQILQYFFCKMEQFIWLHAKLKPNKIRNNLCVDNSAFPDTVEKCILSHLRPHKRSTHIYKYGNEQSISTQQSLFYLPYLSVCICVKLDTSMALVLGGGKGQKYQNYQRKNLLHGYQRRIFKKSFLAPKNLFETITTMI